MKRKQMLFIYNPNAGRGTFAPKLSDVIDTFVKADYEVVVRPTQARLDAYEEVIRMTLSAAAAVTERSMRSLPV